MARFSFSPQPITIFCFLMLSLTSLSHGIGLGLPGLGSFSLNQASGNAQASRNGGGLLANILEDSAAGLGELSNMGSDLSGILQNNGGLGGVVSTIASNNELVDIARQMPISDSVGKVLNLIKNTIPDITTNGGNMAASNQGSRSSFNRDDASKLLDQLSGPRGRTDLSTEILSPQEDNQPPRRPSDAPNELVNNQSQEQQLQQYQPLMNTQNQFANNAPLPVGFNSQNSLMNRLNQYGELQPPVNMPLDLMQSQIGLNQLPRNQPTQQVNLLLQNPSIIPLDGKQSAVAAGSMANLASVITPNVLNQSASSGALQNSNISPEIINRLSSSGLLQRITPELINRLIASGTLQNINSISDLINRLSSTGFLANQNTNDQASQIAQNLLGQLGSANIRT